MNVLFSKAPFHFLIYFFLILMGCSVKDDIKPDIITPLPTKSLKSASTSFSVGIATSTPKLDLLSYTQIIEREFESITAEYQMKMNVILLVKGTYNWSKADQIVNYAVSKGLKVHGHALVWHESTPDWLLNYQGTDAQFEQEVKDYITAVVSRYKGKVTSWDVVNEGVSDSAGALRNTVFKQRMGDDYMVKCFQFAHDADPDSKLFYNDYNLETNIAKQNKVFELIKDWKLRKVPIHGIGFQMHISYLTPKDQIQTATNKAVASGLLLFYSELDIRANPNKDISTFTLERSAAQQSKYKEVVQIYNAIPMENKFGITVWGLKDDDSWLLKHHNNFNEWPLLFDANFNAKQAHTGFLEGLN